MDGTTHFALLHYLSFDTAWCITVHLFGNGKWINATWHLSVLEQSKSGMWQTYSSKAEVVGN
jgi:hypothetical protein